MDVVGMQGRVEDDEVCIITTSIRASKGLG